MNCTCVPPEAVEQTTNLIQYATCVLVSLLLVLKTISKILKTKTHSAPPTETGPVEATPTADSARRTSLQSPRVVRVQS